MNYGRVFLGSWAVLWGCSAAASAPPVLTLQVQRAEPPPAAIFRVIDAAPRRYPSITCGDASVRAMGGEWPFAAHFIDESSDPALWARCQRLAQLPREKASELSCVSTAEGALWAVSLRGPQAYGDSASWHLVYAPLKGAPLRTPDIDAAVSPGDDPAIAGNQGSGPALAVAVTDLDGDGVSELLTNRYTPSDVSGHSFDTIELWTISKRAIAAFGDSAAHHFIQVVDTNEDGRLELLEDPYDTTFGSSYGWVRSQAGWSQLVEVDARGRFSADGALARKWAVDLCPTADDLLEWLPKQDPLCLAQYAHCGRLWGVDPAALKDAYDAFCETEAETVPVGWCDSSYGGWLGIIGSAPPFVLKATDKAVQP